MRFLNVSDLTGLDWRFLEPVCDDPALSWDFFRGQPSNRLERAIRRPNLARWRAALEIARAGRAATQPVALVSHLPRMTAATDVMRRMLCPEVPHVAFAFNFTDLPQGMGRTLFSRALRGVDEFVVFSRFERPLYAAEFGIPEQRIRYLPWAMEAPVPGPDCPLPDDMRRQGYLSAIGGEGRDYALLAQVMRARPGLRMVVIARPYSIAGIEFPDNVTVFTNLPGPVTWRIAVESRGLAIPLKTDRTACGHITIVGAQLLGLPLIVTASRGVEDYAAADVTAQVVPAGDAAALGAAMDRVLEDPSAVTRMAEAARAKARLGNGLPGWVGYFQDLAERLRDRI